MEKWKTGWLDELLGGVLGFDDWLFLPSVDIYMCADIGG